MKTRARLRILAVLVAAACASEPTGGGDLLVVSAIDVQPPGASVILGATQQFTATPKTSSGLTVPNRTATWSSSDPGIATISTSGLVTGVAVGVATITARVDDIRADVTVQVTPKPVASVTVEPPQVALQVGGAQQLQATARDAQGLPLPNRPIVFASDNPAIASVSTTGLVVAVAPGNTTVRASSEGRTGTAAISVSPRPASRLGFVTHPVNGTAGLALAPVRVAVQDDIGATISDAITSITLSIADNPGGATLGGTVTVNAVAGVATFNNLVLDKSGAGYTLRASASPLSPGLSNPFTIGAGAANKLALTTQPPATVQSGTPLPVPPVAQIADANGNAVAQAGVQVTVQVVETGVTLSGVLTVTTTANGSATFPNLVLTGPAGTYTLRFIATGLTQAVSNPIVLSGGTAAALGLVTAPSSNAQSGVPFAQQPVVQLQDANGNPVSQAGVPVTATIASGGSSAAASRARLAPALGGQTTVITNAAGRAVFTDLSVSGLVGPYTLSFGAPGLTSTVSPAIAVAAGPPGSVVIVTQPSSQVVNGSPFTTQPVVRLGDAAGNPVAQAGVVITASLAAGVGGLSGTTTAVTDASGTATFVDLGLSGSSPSFRVSFGGPGLIPAVSTDITLVAGSPTRLFVVTQPGGAANGVAFTQQPRVQVLDQNGNGVSEAGIVITAELASGPGILGGTLTAITSTSGLASFTDLMLTGPAGVYVLRFTATGLTPGLSANVGLGAGVPTHLALATQPSAGAASGAAFAQQPVIQIQDGSNNPVALAGVVVSAAISSGGGTLLGTMAVMTDAFGQATFTDLAISGLVGARTLEFTATGLDPVTSDPITITVGAPAALRIVTQPSAAATSGQPFPQQPVIQVEDGGGNAVAQAGINVTVAILTGGGTLGGTATVATVANGRATFAGLSITGTAGNRTLQFTSTGLAPVTSNIIVVSLPTPTQLSITTQPPTPVQSGIAFGGAVIQLLDAGNNPVPQAGVVITAAIFSGGGALSGTLTATTNASGAATFTNLVITGLVGNRVLRFTSGSLTAVNSATVLVTPGTPTRLALTVQPSPSASSGTAFAQQPVVRVQDAAGNNVTGLPSFPVTATIASGSGATLGGGTVVATDGNGVAAFANLALTGSNGTFTLNFAGGGYTPVVSNNVVLGAGSAFRLAITTQPQTPVQSGDVFSPQPVIHLQDASFNPVAQAGVVVTVALQSGNPVLSGTLNATTNASGVATFTNLRITGVTGPRALIFASGGLVSATSNTINVTPGDATTIAANSSQSQSATVATTVAQDPSVLVTDASGNAVQGVNVTFTVTAGGGTTSPASPAIIATNASGVATLTSWTLGTTAGTNNNTVSATAAGLGGSPVTFTASGTAGAATTIAANSDQSQSATVGSAVAEDPSVLVTDTHGNPKAGVNVTFTVTAGGGTTTPASPAVIATNASGIATLTSWTLGNVAGTNNNTVQATAALGGSPVTFTASATAGGATTIAANSNQSQTATVATAVPADPSVLVTDGGGNPVAGVNVTFTVTAGGGSTSPVSPAVVATNASGIATLTSWTLGTVAGTNNNTVTATATGLGGSPVTFTASATAGNATTIAANSTQSQTATVATAVPVDPSVLVTDTHGNPKSGVSVTFTVTAGGGSTSPASPAVIVTNASGIATLTSWTLGTTAGTNNNTVQATAALGGSPVTFTSSATADAATTIAANSSQSQTATVATAVPADPSVLVTDTHGNPKSGVSVTFTVTAGGGSTSPASPAVIVTNASGIATLTSWTLGTTAGTNNNTVQATAALGGSPVTFTSSATADAATTIAANSSQSQTATVATAVPADPSVLVTDTHGNPKSGVSVTFTVTAGGGSTSPASPAIIVTNASGIATLTSWTLGTTAGTNNNTVQATAALGGSPVTFTSSATADAANSIDPASVQSQSATVGTDVGAPPSVVVTDVHGNPKSGVSVTFTLTADGTGGSISPASPAVIVTNSSGIATLVSWTLGTDIGTDNNTVTATATGLGGSPVTFNASGTAEAARAAGAAAAQALERLMLQL